MGGWVDFGGEKVIGQPQITLCQCQRFRGSVVVEGGRVGHLRAR